MRRFLAIALLALAAVAGLPSTARAGGPTSVLITQPGASAAALYYSDDAYDELARLLPSDATRGKELPPGSGGLDYTLTWMVHDVMPWRFDRVRIARDGTAWVSTSFAADAAGGWAPFEAAGELAALLDGVLEGGAAPVLVPSAPAPEPTSPASVAPEPRTEWFSLTGWRWVVPGALLGLLVGAVAARGRRAADAEPRRQLVEA